VLNCPACGVEVDRAGEGATCPACGAALPEPDASPESTLQATAGPRNQWIVDQPGIEPYHYLTSTGRLRSGRTPPPRPPANDPETGDGAVRASGEDL